MLTKIRLSAWLREDGKAIFSHEGSPVQDSALTLTGLWMQLHASLGKREIEMFMADFLAFGSAETWVLRPRSLYRAL